MRWLAPHKDYDKEPLECLASLKSTTLSNMTNLKNAKSKSKVYIHKVKNPYNISPCVGFLASSCIHNMGVNGCVLPIVAFVMNLHHFPYILLLQIEANHKHNNININDNPIKVC
jgi:hypothetical protein